MATREELLAEVEKRGLQAKLSPRLQELLGEATKRKLPSAVNSLISSPAPSNQLERNEPELDAGINPLEGNAQGLLQGATFGFSDEIQSIIAAAVASPFISDKTFSQLMVDARTSFRNDRAEFQEQEGWTAHVPEAIGGMASGGVGAIKTIGKEVGKYTLKQLAKVGAVEGAISGVGFADADEFVSHKTVKGGLDGAIFGGILGYVIPGAGAVLTRKFKEYYFKNNKDIKIFEDSGAFTQEALDELDSMVKRGETTTSEISDLVSSNAAQEGVLTSEQAKRFNLFAERGVTPNRANVTQAVDDFSDLQSSAKHTGLVSENIAKQDEQLIDLAEKGIDSIGPSALDLPQTNSSIFRAIDDEVTKLDDIVSGAYTQAREASRGQPLVLLSRLNEVVHNSRGKDIVSGGVVPAIRGILENKGLLKVQKSLDPNKRGPRLKSGDIKKTTVTEAEEIRQELNSLYDSVTPQGRRVIRDLKNAIDDDVAGAIGEDLFDEARKAKTSFHKAIERPRRNKFDKSRASLLEDIIDNKVSEKDIVAKLISSRDDEFVKMKSFLSEGSGNAGKQAWLDLKSQVLRDALDAATSTAGKTAKGGKVFLASRFTNRLKKLKSSGKYKELFNADERALIDDISEIGRLRVPQGNVQQGKGPSELVVEAFRGEVLKRIPVIGESAQGLRDMITRQKQAKRLLSVTRETEAALNK